MITEIQPQTKYIINNVGLSREADDYLRVSRKLFRGEGLPAAEIAQRLNEWCDGYRAFGEGKPLDEMPAGETALGWEYAHGEYSWHRCLDVDGAQDSAAAAGYPYGF